MHTPLCVLALIATTVTSVAAESTEQLGDVGHATLWVAFFGLFLPTLYFCNATMQQAEGKRYFHVLTTTITAIASLAYLVMAMGYGVTSTYDGRPFFYARCK